MVGTGADSRTSVYQLNEETTLTPTFATDDTKVSNLLESVGTFDPAVQTADDLKKIEGIDSEMEETLNNIGIFTYAQVSKMTNREYTLLDEITGAVPGRAEGDDWSGQAKKLIN